MGRKLNTLEEVQAAFADSEENQQGAQAQSQKQHLERIAHTLGITTAVLRGHPAPPNAIRPASDPTRQNEIVLAQQCVDLVKAFAEIQDPQARLHCLKIVRDAAEVKFSGSVL